MLAVLEVLPVLVFVLAVLDVLALRAKRGRRRAGRMQKTGLHLRMGSALSFLFLFVENQYNFYLLSANRICICIVDNK